MLPAVTAPFFQNADISTKGSGPAGAWQTNDTNAENYSNVYRVSCSCVISLMSRGRRHQRFWRPQPQPTSRQRLCTSTLPLFSGSSPRRQESSHPVNLLRGDRFIWICTSVLLEGGVVSQQRLQQFEFKFVHMLRISYSGGRDNLDHMILRSYCCTARRLYLHADRS